MKTYCCEKRRQEVEAKKAAKRADMCRRIRGLLSTNDASSEKKYDKDEELLGKLEERLVELKERAETAEKLLDRFVKSNLKSSLATQDLIADYLSSK